MIQLAKGVLASNFGLNDPNLLAEEFVYVEPLMGPLEKEKYLEVFSREYTVREGVPDLDYGLQVSRLNSGIDHSKVVICMCIVAYSTYLPYRSLSHSFSFDSSVIYQIQNFRVDPYDPYRVWVDSR